MCAASLPPRSAWRGTVAVVATPSGVDSVPSKAAGVEDGDTRIARPVGAAPPVEQLDGTYDSHGEGADELGPRVDHALHALTGDVCTDG